MEMTPEQIAALRSPFDELVGVTIEVAAADRVVARLTVQERLHQPGGIVHGGVYTTLVEGTAGLGATIWLAGEAVAVGVSNHTDFLRAVNAGALTAVATPLQRGRRFQLWQVMVTDDEDRLAAHGKVKLANLPRQPDATAPAPPGASEA